jgi:hypothetical protein
VRTIGTYPGHSPSIDRALDLFHAISDHALATDISNFAIQHQELYGVRYVIDRQRIWHRLDPIWRWMEDRGDATQNHLDHNHVSFELEGAIVLTPDPTPSEGVDDMFTYSTHKSIDGGSIWLVISGTAYRLHLPADHERMTKAGVPSFGEMSASFHNLFPHVG